MLTELEDTHFPDGRTMETLSRRLEREVSLHPIGVIAHP